MNYYLSTFDRFAKHYLSIIISLILMICVAQILYYLTMLCVAIKLKK